MQVDDFFDYLDVNDNGKLQLDELELLLNCFEKGAKQAEKKLAISQACIPFVSLPHDLSLPHPPSWPLPSSPPSARSHSPRNCMTR